MLGSATHFYYCVLLSCNFVLLCIPYVVEYHAFDVTVLYTVSKNRPVDYFTIILAN